jgi:hypothetical protein
VSLRVVSALSNGMASRSGPGRMLHGSLAWPRSPPCNVVDLHHGVVPTHFAVGIRAATEIVDFGKDTRYGDSETLR